jgi:integrase
LRRLNATTLVVGGIDVKTAQVRLGHADPRMTLAIYASSLASVDREAADVIGERFFGDNGKKPRAASKTRNLRAISAPIALEEPGTSDS